MTTAMTKSQMADRIAQLERINRRLENEIDNASYDQEIIITAGMLTVLAEGRTIEVAGRCDNVTLVPREDDGATFRLKLTIN